MQNTAKSHIEKTSDDWSVATNVPLSSADRNNKKSSNLYVPPVYNRLLIIASEFPPNVGGIGNHAYHLARALAMEGYKVSVVADTIAVENQDLKKFAAEEPFKIHWIRRKRLVASTYLHRIATALCVAAKADKIICSGKFSLWIATLIKARYPGKELIAVVHGTELDLKSATPKKATTYSLGKFDKVIAVSDYTRSFLPRSLPARIHQFTIHNGISGGEFSITASSSKLGGEPALITVGNVTERKGQLNVINALPTIAQLYPGVQYHIVGKPTNKESIQASAKTLGVEHKVTSYGAVSRDDLLQKLRSASIKLMLSNHTSEGDFEGFGIAVLEANAFGVPAIGSKNSGIAEAIVHGQTGLLVDPNCPKEIAEAVKLICHDYIRFSNNAKAWARQHDWKIIVKEYVAAINM
ncbi:MAG: glycosyltransferase family 4 protein [Bacteroidota bacterium]|nr:glycosyltransferase family 4 protein [Bacteroidota bacterium]